MAGFKIKIDSGFNVCYECYNKIAKEQGITNPAQYKGKLLKIVPVKECDICNKVIKINVSPHN